MLFNKQTDDKKKLWRKPSHWIFGESLMTIKYQAISKLNFQKSRNQISKFMDFFFFGRLRGRVDKFRIESPTEIQNNLIRRWLTWKFKNGFCFIHHTVSCLLSRKVSIFWELELITYLVCFEWICLSDWLWMWVTETLAGFEYLVCLESSWIIAHKILQVIPTINHNSHTPLPQSTSPDPDLAEKRNPSQRIEREWEKKLVLELESIFCLF